MLNANYIEEFKLFFPWEEIGVPGEKLTTFGRLVDLLLFTHEYCPRVHIENQAVTYKVKGKWGTHFVHEAPHMRIVVLVFYIVFIFMFCSCFE